MFSILLFSYYPSFERKRGYSLGIAFEQGLETQMGFF